MDTSRPSETVSRPADLDGALADIRERTLIVSALLDQIDEWASSLPPDGVPEKLCALIVAAREHAERAAQATKEFSYRVV